MSSGTSITSVEEVPRETTLIFTVRDVESGEKREAVLTELADGVAGWMNYCQHLTHIPLDKGSGAPMRDGEIICANHGAYFESDSGRCTYGPCEGAFLEGIDVTAEDGNVYLTDEKYEFVATGGIETDDLDRTSTSNVEF
ncbi:Rieske (2Fe-2S) protein [Natronoarchaeum sp. GCM10025703]|uniref:Rieske (2Fe-2S) protein n=1 Tax=unclassified Natronoarchaeum TaxID=2620183 RepID=UPI00360DDD01